MNRWSTILVVIAALALAGCAKGNGSSETTTTTHVSAAPATTATAGGTSSGLAVYNANCATCHGATGAGQVGAFPPLEKNAVVAGDPKRVIRIVKFGLKGPVVVNGVTYNGQMPAWSGTLSDDQIAAVISYTRTAWGNAAPPVTPAQVAALK